MRSTNTCLSVAAIVTLSLVPVHAQGRGGAHAPQNTAHASSQPTTHGPSTTHGPGTSGTTKSGTTTTSSTTSNAGTSTTSSGSTTTTTNPIATKIQSHPQLANRITTMLKQTGLTLDQASSGFRNQGQFIAALHVSQNLGIKFTDLKNTMLGTTASTGTTGTTTTGTTTTGTSTTTMSLGQAIHKLRPSVDSESAAKQATTQATGDLNK